MSERLQLVREAIVHVNAAQEKAVHTIKTLLDEATKDVLKRRSQPFKTPKLAEVRLEGLSGFFVDLGAQSEDSMRHRYVSEHVVLNSDGKLYRLDVVGESGEDGEDGEWEYEGTLGKELDSQEYLRFGPAAMQKLEQLLSEQPVTST